MGKFTDLVIELMNNSWNATSLEASATKTLKCLTLGHDIISEVDRTNEKYCGAYKKILHKINEIIPLATNKGRKIFLNEILEVLWCGNGIIWNTSVFMHNYEKIMNNESVGISEILGIDEEKFRIFTYFNSKFRGYIKTIHQIGSYRVIESDSNLGGFHPANDLSCCFTDLEGALFHEMNEKHAMALYVLWKDQWKD